MKMKVWNWWRFTWARNTPVGWGGLAIFERLNMRFTSLFVFTLPGAGHNRGIAIGFIRKDALDDR